MFQMVYLPFAGFNRLKTQRADFSIKKKAGDIKDFAPAFFIIYL